MNRHDDDLIAWLNALSDADRRRLFGVLGLKPVTNDAMREKERLALTMALLDGKPATRPN